MSQHGYDPDLYGAVGAVFADAVDPVVVAAAETQGLSTALWRRISELDFPLVGVATDRGGSGGTVLDTLAIAVQSGRHAVPLPLVESHLAAWLLADAGVDLDTAPMTAAPGTSRDEVTVVGEHARGVLHDVPWARGAERVVALVDDGEVTRLISITRPEVDAGRDLAGLPCDRVRFEDATAVEAGPTSSTRALFLRGALLRAGQMAGALEALADLTIEYCGQRHQFGKPLHAFQAVQQHLVVLAQSAELAASAVARAGLASSEREASFEVCSAKLVAGRSASAAVRAAHQAHGAISMTREYRLQQLTCRLHSWRWQFGTEPQLARALGAAVTAKGAFAATVAAEQDSVEVSACPAP